MDRLVSIPERVLSYQSSKAEERARLRVQRIVSIPGRVWVLLRINTASTLPYLRLYRTVSKIGQKMKRLINCNRLTTLTISHRTPITVKSGEWFQASCRHSQTHLEGSTSLSSNERELEYRDIFLAPVMFTVTTGMAFSIVHFLIDLALRERSAFLSSYRKEKSMQNPPRSKKWEPPFFQLPIPLYRQPFLQVKRKLREKESRAAIDGIEKYANLLKFKLKTGAIHSSEAKVEIRQFLETLGLM